MSWEDELKKRWYLHHFQDSNEINLLGGFVTCGEEVADFIKSLLKEQREVCANEISDACKLLARSETLNAPEPKGIK